MEFQHLKLQCVVQISKLNTGRTAMPFIDVHRRFSLEEDMAAVSGDCSFEQQTPATFVDEGRRGRFGIPELEQSNWPRILVLIVCCTGSAHDSSGTLGVCRSLSPSLLRQSLHALFNVLHCGKISRIYFRRSIFDHMLVHSRSQSQPHLCFTAIMNLLCTTSSGAKPHATTSNTPPSFSSAQGGMKTTRIHLRFPTSDEKLLQRSRVVCHIGSK